MTTALCLLTAWNYSALVHQSHGSMSESMMNKTCELGLSNCWQCWWHDRRTQRVKCFVPSFSSLSPLSAPERGDAGSRVFVMGRWQRRYSTRADGKCVYVFFCNLWVYVCVLCVGMHLMCVEALWLHGLSALEFWLQFNTRNKRKLKAGRAQCTVIPVKFNDNSISGNTNNYDT